MKHIENIFNSRCTKKCTKNSMQKTLQISMNPKARHIICTDNKFKHTSLRTIAIICLAAGTSCTACAAGTYSVSGAGLLVWDAAGVHNESLGRVGVEVILTWTMFLLL